MRRMRLWASALVCLGMWAGLAVGPVATADLGTIPERHAASAGCGEWDLEFSPNPLEENLLHGVAAVSATDVWAVGHAFTESGPQQPLIEHWDGQAWGVITTSLPDDANLQAISAIDANDVWAVGSTFSVTTDTFAAHWDGSSWTSVPVPSVRAPSYWGSPPCPPMTSGRLAGGEGRTDWIERWWSIGMGPPGPSSHRAIQVSSNC